MSRRFADLTPYEGYEDAIVEKKDGVVVFTLNRPKKRCASAWPTWWCRTIS